MTLSSSQPRLTAVLEDGQDGWRPVACPMCHTPASLTRSALEAGDHWRCARCGQHWDAVRLAAVAGYAAWALERDAVAAGRDRASPPEIPATEPPGGTP